MAKFVQKTSITRTFTLTVLAISVLFAFEFLGFYLSSRSFLKGMTRIHELQMFLNTVSTLRQITDSLGAALRRPKPSAKVFDGINDEAAATLKNARQFGQMDSRLSAYLKDAGAALDELAESGGRFFLAHSLRERERELLLAQQFESDATEMLDLLKVVLEKQSDEQFKLIYSRRYRPFAVSVILAVVCMVLTLGAGLRLTHDLHVAIMNLLEATRDVARGRVDVHAPILTRDEIGNLTNAFNEMIVALRSRDEFLSIASHELKTPLTSLTLRLHIINGELRKQFDAPTEEMVMSRRTASMAMKCEEESIRLVRLLDGLLDLTRIRLGGLHLERERVDLCKVVRDVLDRLRVEAEEKGVAISLLADCPVVGNWDPMRLEQVANNLISNALKYGRQKPVTITIEESPGRGVARLVVEDRGMGISSEAKEKLFSRFERAGGPVRKIEGYGLGLYICRQIIEAHDGTISVESAPGVGSRFIVELPTGIAVGKAA